MDPALWEILKTGKQNDAEEIEAIIRLDSPFQLPGSIRIISRFGPIATCRLKRDKIIIQR